MTKVKNHLRKNKNGKIANVKKHLRKTNSKIKTVNKFSEANKFSKELNDTLQNFTPDIDGLKEKYEIDENGLLVKSLPTIAGKTSDNIMTVIAEQSETFEDEAGTGGYWDLAGDMTSYYLSTKNDIDNKNATKIQEDIYNHIKYGDFLDEKEWGLNKTIPKINDFFDVPDDFEEKYIIGEKKYIQKIKESKDSFCIPIRKSTENEWLDYQKFEKNRLKSIISNSNSKRKRELAKIRLETLKYRTPNENIKKYKEKYGTMKGFGFYKVQYEDGVKRIVIGYKENNGEIYPCA